MHQVCICSQYRFRESLVFTKVTCNSQRRNFETYPTHCLRKNECERLRDGGRGTVGERKFALVEPGIKGWLVGT